MPLAAHMLSQLDLLYDISIPDLSAPDDEDFNIRKKKL